MSLPEKNIKCPATGFSKSCREIYIETEGGCPKYVNIQGLNPNTGETINNYGCVDHFLPLLLIENSQQQRQTGAAVESFRNEMIKSNDKFLQYAKSNSNNLYLENK